MLVADRRLSESSGEVRYEDKTYCKLSQTVWAGAGTREDFGWFNEAMGEKISRGIQIPSLIPTISTVIIEGRDRGLLKDFELLLALRQLGKRKSQVYFFNRDGGCREIEDQFVIGQGEPIGRLMLRKYYKRDLPMFKMVILATMIIKYIEGEELDSSVGVGTGMPTVWWLPDLPEPYLSDEELPPGMRPMFSVRRADETEIEAFREPVDSIVKAWKTHVDSFFGRGGL